MVSFIVLGFLVGIGHALEADHLAAVGALAQGRQKSAKPLVYLGASWGMGHATMLFLLSLIVIVFGYVLSERLAASMEFIVGAMLILLGINIFWKLRRAKIHFHVHRHDGGHRHIHAHSHAGDKVGHSNNPHRHEHGFSLRAFLVGLLHGAAGSSGLIALTAAASLDAWTALGYILVFGLGSIFGMGLLTYAVSWPIRLSANGAGRLFKLAQAATGLTAIYIGSTLMIEHGSILLSGS
jgi:high-affinity nickel permease